jgi:hypothetical protein
LIDVSKKGGSSQGIISSISAIKEDRNKQINESLQLIKELETKRQSSVFKSSVDRFKGLKNQRGSDFKGDKSKLSI